MATHDLTKKGWGENYEFTAIAENGELGRMTVWSGKRIEAGDYLILRNGSGTTRYRVQTVKRMIDPPDQMFLDVVFAPRSPEGDPTPEEDLRGTQSFGEAEVVVVVPEMPRDGLAEFAEQFLALDQAQLYQWLEGAIDMYIEFVELHGYDSKSAKYMAINEIVGGARAIVELQEFGQL